MKKEFKTLSEKITGSCPKFIPVLAIKRFIEEILKLAEYLPTEQGTKFMQKIIKQEAGEDLIDKTNYYDKKENVSRG